METDGPVSPGGADARALSLQARRVKIAKIVRSLIVPLYAIPKSDRFYIPHSGT